MEGSVYQYGFYKVKLIECKKSESGRDLVVIEDENGNTKEVFKSLWDKHSKRIFNGTE